MLAAASIATACSDRDSASDIDALAQEYVHLGLSYAKIEPDALDFYFGPDDLAPLDGEPDRGREALFAELNALRARLAAVPATARSENLTNRVDSLIAIIGASRADKDTTFTEQTQRLYGITAIAPEGSSVQTARERLDGLLPGSGSLAERVDDYASGFVVAEDRRKAVFERALEECQMRTRANWSLPVNEELEVEWTDEVPAAWHFYRGDGHSVLQVNPQAVADIGSALDVACHEAYPGHHAQFLLQANAGGFAPEDMLVFTRSPEQLLREGAGQYGVDLAFPLAERTAFLRDELFPIAGFDPGEAERFARVHVARQAVGAATAPILAKYLDGRMTGFAAEQALVNEALISSPAALLGYARRYGAYVLGYSVAREAVAACVDARTAGHSAAEEARWHALYEIVASNDLAALHGEACQD